ncbi:DUF4382 domain-containing protein [Chloroflexota bacterium]
MKVKIIAGLVLSISALSLGACTGESTPAPGEEASESEQPVIVAQATSQGTIDVYVTDAPRSDNVTSIMVTVSEVQVHRAAAEQEQEQTGEGTQTQEEEQEQTQEGDGEWITIDLIDATTFDLLEIEGIEQFIGANVVEAGKYTQVRLVVDSVQVALSGGELQNADLPSNELKIVRPFDVVAGETTVLVIDFDADQMVTITGSGRINVKPVVKLITRQEKSQDKTDDVELEDETDDEEEPQDETNGDTLVEVSCDNFTSNNNISREVEITAGESFSVTLCSNGTTGFTWSEMAQIANQSIISQVRHRFVSPEDEELVGSPGQEIWTFQALEAGNTTISMEYSQPWEGGTKAEWTFELTVVVN